MMIFLLLYCNRTQAGVLNDTTILLQKIRTSVTPQDKIKALLAIADYHLENKLPDIGAYQRSGRYIEEALAISRSKKNVELEQESLFMMSKRAARLNDSAACLQTAMEVIGYYQNTRNRQAEAETWFRLALAFQRSNPYAMFPYSNASHHARHFNIIQAAQQKCIAIALQIGNKQLAARAYMQEAYLYLQRAEYLKADAEARKALILLEKNEGALKKYAPYHLLMLTSLGRSKHDSAMYYGLEALRNAEATEQWQDIHYIYMYMGTVYFLAKGAMNQSVDALKKYLLFCEKYQRPIHPSFFRVYSEALRLTGKITEAAEYMKTFDVTNPLYTPVEIAQLYTAFGRVCTFTKQLPQAEKYYQAAIAEAEKIPLPNRMAIYISVGEFYYSIKKIDKSRIYFEKALGLADTVNLAINRINVHNYLFLLDTIDKKYVSAIAHGTAFIRWKDTLNTITARNNIMEFQTKYETEKKERDIRLLTARVKEQQYKAAARKIDLELLNNKLKLQESEADRKQKDIYIKNQSISLLTKENSVRKNQLDKISTERKAILGGIGLLVVISGLLLYQSRIKHQSNATIMKKNVQLQQLVQEKELLVKEIHHRVKNNLQTVVSLLESQSVYLTNEALRAVQDSQNRIHMMSALHQSLYQGDNMSTINMAAYLPLMASYLKDSFNTAEQIQFQFSISPVELEVSQAVPVGLIFNEAVTNAFKYAFTDSKEQKKIELDMRVAEDGKVTLVIADNGKGLPDGFNIDENTGVGLGFTLIRSLVKNDLKGKLSIKKERGTEISVIFMITDRTHNINSTTTV